MSVAVLLGRDEYNGGIGVEDDGRDRGLGQFLTFEEPDAEAGAASAFRDMDFIRTDAGIELARAAAVPGVHAADRWCEEFGPTDRARIRSGRR